MVSNTGQFRCLLVILYRVLRYSIRY